MPRKVKETHMLEGLVVMLIAVGVLFWLFILGSALGRDDLDPVTRFMWVFVIVMTSVLGAILYLLIAPSRQIVSASQADDTAGTDDTSEETPCVACGTTIPAGARACPKCGWSYADAKP
jgi:hypothetical protein